MFRGLFAVLLVLSLTTVMSSSAHGEGCVLPEGPCDSGCYSISNGNYSWGLTLNELFGPGTGLYNFSFDEEGLGGLLCYDAAKGTVSIEAVGYGGNHTDKSLVTINYNYTGVVCNADATRIIAYESGYGTLVWEATGEVIELFGMTNYDDEFGLIKNGKWLGWLSYVDGVDAPGNQDFNFILTPYCPEETVCVVPEETCDSGCYTLTNGNYSWGLTLNELFGPGTDLYNFSFDEEGLGGLLCYDAANGTVSIEAVGYGGNHTDKSLVTINFNYTGVLCNGDATRIIAYESGYGTLVWEASGEVIELFGMTNYDDEFGLIKNGKWLGWISYVDGVDAPGNQDFNFILTPGCPDAVCDGSIGDQAFLDVDGDGIFGGDDQVTPGVGITVEDADGVVVATATTDEDGLYRVEGLCAGDYTVLIDPETIPEGMELSPHCSPMQMLTLADGENVDTVDFCFTVACVPVENLIVNGSFEDTPDLDGCYRKLFQQIPGWTTCSGRGMDIHRYYPALEGNNMLELDSIYNSSMYQDVPTEPGKVYELSFGYSPRPGVCYDSNYILVYWNGQYIKCVTRNGGYTTQWRQYTCQVVGGEGTTSRLKFRAAGRSDCVGGYLDNVSLKCENLVANGSFEWNPLNYCRGWGVYPAIEGWSTSFGPGIEIQKWVAGWPLHGDALVELDSHDNSGMYQDIATLPGKTYTVSFAYSPRPRLNTESNTIEVLWDGQVIDTIAKSGFGLCNTQWRIHTYTVEASDYNTRLEFRAGGESECLGGYVDSICVTGCKPLIQLD